MTVAAEASTTAVSGCRPRSGRHPDRGHYRRLPFRCIERGAGLVAAGPWADVQDKVLLVALPGVAHKQRGCAARRTCRIPQRILLSTATDRSLE